MPSRKRTPRYRAIRGAAADHAVAYYATEDVRNLAAQTAADHDGEPVICEFWDASHEQAINGGWAMDRFVGPGATPCEAK